MSHWSHGSRSKKKVLRYFVFVLLMMNNLPCIQHLPPPATTDRSQAHNTCTVRRRLTRSRPIRFFLLFFVVPKRGVDCGLFIRIFEVNNCLTRCTRDCSRVISQSIQLICVYTLAAGSWRFARRETCKAKCAWWTCLS